MTGQDCSFSPNCRLLTWKSCRIRSAAGPSPRIRTPNRASFRAEHSHWDWDYKSGFLAEPGVRCLGVECAGRMQGMMLIRDNTVDPTKDPARAAAIAPAAPGADPASSEAARIRRFTSTQNILSMIFLGVFATTVTVPAYLMLGYWILLQVLGGIPALAGLEGGGVAYWAHIGGFGAGLLLIRFFAKPENLSRRPTPPQLFRSWA